MALQIYKIASAEVGSAGTTTVDFNNIPQGYTDLLLVSSTRTAAASTYGAINYRFNGSSTGYYSRNLEGGDGATGSYTQTNAAQATLGYMSGANATANAFGSQSLYIPNYTSSNYKSSSVDSVGESNTANGIYNNLFSQVWQNTAAITSINLLNLSYNITQYTTFTLYGIL